MSKFILRGTNSNDSKFLVNDETIEFRFGEDVPTEIILRMDRELSHYDVIFAASEKVSKIAKDAGKSGEEQKAAANNFSKVATGLYKEQKDIRAEELKKLQDKMDRLNKAHLAACKAIMLEALRVVEDNHAEFEKKVNDLI